MASRVTPLGARGFAESPDRCAVDRRYQRGVVGRSGIIQDRQDGLWVGGDEELRVQQHIPPALGVDSMTHGVARQIRLGGGPAPPTSLVRPIGEEAVEHPARAVRISLTTKVIGQSLVEQPIQGGAVLIDAPAQVEPHQLQSCLDVDVDVDDDAGDGKLATTCGHHTDDD